MCTINGNIKCFGKILYNVVRLEITFHIIVIIIFIQICIVNVNARIQCDHKCHNQRSIVVSLVTIVLLCHLSRIYNLPMHNSASSLALFLPFFLSFILLDFLAYGNMCVYMMLLSFI